MSIAPLPRVPAEDVWERWALPLALTIIVHGALGGGVRYFGTALQRDRGDQLIEFDIEEAAPAPAPEPKIEPEPPPPEPPAPEEEPAEPEIAPDQPPPKPAKVARIRPATPPPPDSIEPSSEPPAAGPNSNDDLPAPQRVFRMPDQGVGGSVPVALGKPTGRHGGVPGGRGTNTGGGGDDDSKGTGVAKKPVSVSALKRMPEPISGQDYRSEKYPEEAERLRIEGKVKVRVVIDEAGKVIGATVVKPLGHGLDKRALTLARALRFRPALDQNDKPVTTAIVWTFTFTLPD